MAFPIKGKVLGADPWSQPPLTSRTLQNVLPVDNQGILHGGQRPALSLYWPSTVRFGSGSDRVFQGMHQADIQETDGTIINYIFIACGGLIYRMTPTSTTALVINPTVSMSAARTFTAFATFENVTYMTDGLKYLRIDNTVTSGAGTAAAVFTPSGIAYNDFRYLASYHGRLCWARSDQAGHAWHFSEIADPSDYTYTGGPDSAIAGTSDYRLGRLGQPIRMIHAWTDDAFLFGCDHSIHKMVGDPAMGGSLGPLAETVGVLSNTGVQVVEDKLYFFGTGGAFRLGLSGGGLENLSAGKVERDFWELPQQGYKYNVVFERDKRLIYFFRTKSSDNTQVHYAYSLDTDGWFPLTLGGGVNNAVQMALTYDGHATNSIDRVILLGCSDGYVRTLDWSSATDVVGDGAGGTTTASIEAFFETAPFQLGYGDGGTGRVLYGDVNMADYDTSLTSSLTLKLKTGPDPDAASESPQYTLTKSYTNATGRQKRWLNCRASGAVGVLRGEKSSAGSVFGFSKCTFTIVPSGRRRK